MDWMQQVLKQLTREQHHLDEALQGTAEDHDHDLLQMDEGEWNPMARKKKSPPKKGSLVQLSHHQLQRPDLDYITNFDPVSTTLAKTVVASSSAAITEDIDLLKR